MTELMSRRRALMGAASQGGILPPGYRQVSAIRIPLDGVIRTGLPPTATSIISITARINSDFSDRRTIWSARGISANAGILTYVCAQSGNDNIIFWQRYSKHVACENKRDNNKHTYVSNQRTRNILIDGDSFTVDDAPANVPTRSILLSADYTSNTSADTDWFRKSDLTVWAYSHSSETQRTQTLIPCQQLSNNEYGLFDLEGNVFIGNIGSGIITEDNT